MDSTGGTNAAFDFTTKGILQEALARSELWRLVDAQVRGGQGVGHLSPHEPPDAPNVSHDAACFCLRTVNALAWGRTCTAGKPSHRFLPSWLQGRPPGFVGMWPSRAITVGPLCQHTPVHACL